MRYLIVVLFLIAGCSTRAQVTEPRMIYDEVSDVKFKIVGAKDSSTFADYKGKLIILDFWATWCTNCIREFPKMDSLQTRYKDKIKIFLVNHTGGGDSLGTVIRFLEKWKLKHGSSINLPIVMADKNFYSLFKCRALGQKVWIGHEGRITAMTLAGFLTEENINIALKYIALKQVN